MHGKKILIMFLVWSESCHWMQVNFLKVFRKSVIMVKRSIFTAAAECDHLQAKYSGVAPDTLGLLMSAPLSRRHCTVCGKHHKNFIEPVKRILSGSVCGFPTVLCPFWQATCKAVWPMASSTSTLDTCCTRSWRSSVLPFTASQWI